ncbi:MAG: 16S rRNA (guanine(966)-N(2))-methyltransferase RsmD [Anaerolineales bacterium]|nr:16S rRNA (guanine(966)-N(2))-methyltransferase RsmD [Anaerolineales bacterium]
MGNLSVIAGKVGGFNLKSVPGGITRPVMAVVKESVFNIVAPYVINSSWLDLFGGTGSVGIEALSRGASFVRFVDIHSAAIKTIHANLGHTGLSAQAEVWHTDAFRMLEKEPDRKFDFIYIAPPQYHELWSASLEKIQENIGWCWEDTWVIVQIDPVEYQPLGLNRLKLFDRREYGSTELLFYLPIFAED